MAALLGKMINRQPRDGQNVHSAKCRGDRSSRYRDTAIFRFSIRRPSAILDFQVRKRFLKIQNNRQPLSLIEYRKIAISGRRIRRKETEKNKRKKPYNGKLRIRRDHPRRRIQLKLCIVGGLRGRSSYKVHISSKSIKRFRSCGGSKFALLH